jgi:hypothetical protein
VLAAPQVERPAARHHRDVGAEVSAGRAVAVGVGPQPDEGLLGGVLGPGVVSEHAARGEEGPPAVSEVDLAEHVRIGEGSGHGSTVRAGARAR